MRLKSKSAQPLTRVRAPKCLHGGFQGYKDQPTFQTNIPTWKVTAQADSNFDFYNFVKHLLAHLFGCSFCLGQPLSIHVSVIFDILVKYVNLQVFSLNKVFLQKSTLFNQLRKQRPFQADKVSSQSHLVLPKLLLKTQNLSNQKHRHLLFLSDKIKP